MRDDVSTIKSTSVSAKDICDRANGARVVVPNYNEPLITSEWAVEVFKEAKQIKNYGPLMFRTDMERLRCWNISVPSSI